MKKFMYFGIAAIALSMAACSSDDEVMQNPEELGAVKTEFNIAIPGNVKTRMTDAITQAQDAPVFRGMESIVLIPFGKGGAIVDSDVRLGENIVLGTNGAVPTITADNTISSLNEGNNSQYYKDVTVPIGTRSFLFYGVAPETTATAPATNNEVNGKLVLSGTDGNTPASIKADLQKIYTGTTDGMATALVNYLTAIANAKDATNTDADWSQNTNMYNALRAEFLKMRAGSSANVQALVQDLYTQLADAENPTATAIKTAILTKAEANTAGVLTFDPSLGDLTDVTKCYPSKIYLPDGAAVVSWNNDSKAFEIQTSPLNQLGVNVSKLDAYTYPASLYYRVNSQIKTDEVTHAADYTSTTTWAGEGGLLSKYAHDNGTVAVNTKSIAIKDQIQYAVARLDLKVKAPSATLQDNEDANKTVGTQNFRVTGVLVGGQKQVDFQFKPIGTDEFTIYDNQVPADMYLKEATSSDGLVVNRTLVLETAGGDDEVVKFAIEFVNNGEDFVGADGIVPSGCKFYLLGEMDMSKIEATNKKVDGVFVQDYYTTVVATVNNLKKAYNVVPDLRAPKLELGLSVDLTWREANTFNVTIQ